MPSIETPPIDSFRRQRRGKQEVVGWNVVRALDSLVLGHCDVEEKFFVFDEIDLDHHQQQNV